MTMSEMWETLKDMGVSEETLKAVTDINGYTEESMKDILYSRFGYHDFDQLENNSIFNDMQNVTEEDQERLQALVGIMQDKFEEKTLRGYLIDLKGEGKDMTITYKDQQDKLEKFYKMLDCSLIDIAHFEIGNSEYDFILDDEGLFYEELTPSLVSVDGKVKLVGKLFIVKGNDETGELEDLEDSDIKNLQEHTLRSPEGYEIICEGSVEEFMKNQLKRFSDR